MANSEEVSGLRVFVPREPKKGAEGRGPKRFGKVHHLVFSPSGLQVVGVMVKRPDVAGMVKRPDVFVAWDRVSVLDQGLLVSGDDARDQAAAQRLGLDLDRCLIWQGMDARCEDGTELGTVGDVEFDPATGRVRTLLVSDGAWAASLVGSVPVTAEHLVGYRDGAMVVANEVRQADLTGGLAAKAGEAAGKAQQKGQEAASRAAHAAGEALDKGSFALGKAIGSAKRAVQGAMADAEEPAEKGSRVMAATAADGGDPRRSDMPKTPERAELTGDDTIPSERPPLYVPTGTVSVTEATGEEAPAAPPAPSAADAAAKAVGRQLGKTKGMFGAFVKEFKEASK